MLRMANPQLENGYTKISNELLEVLGFIQLPATEYQVLMVIFRMTYGYNQKTAEIKNWQLCYATGLIKNAVSRSIKGLKEKNIIIRNGNITSINKDYETWKLTDLLTKKLTNQLTIEEKKLTNQLTAVNNPVNFGGQFRGYLTTLKEIIKKRNNKYKDIDKNKKNNIIRKRVPHNASVKDGVMDPGRFKGQRYENIIKH